MKMLPELPVFRPFVDYVRELNESSRIFNGSLPNSEFVLEMFNKLFQPLLFCSQDDILTSEEIEEVENSLRDLAEGRAKEFSSVENCITWLKRD